MAGNKVLWRGLETAKRRLFYSLLRLGLPLISKQEDPEAGLAFAFLADADPLFTENTQTLTGHAQGLITINLAEADDAWRKSRIRNYGRMLGRRVVFDRGNV